MKRIEYIFIYLYQIIFSIFTLAGKIIFGNSIGFVHNIIPRINLMKLRAKNKEWKESLNLNIHENNITEAQELYKNGIIIFRDSDSSTELNSANSKLESIYNDTDKFVYSPNGTQKRMKDPLRDLPEVKNIFPRRICNTICNYYGTTFKIYSVQVWRNLGQDMDTDKKIRSDIMSNSLHNDMCPLTGLRIFVYLSKQITKETGAFKYIDKRRTKYIMRTGQYFNRMIKFKHQFKLLDGYVKYFEGELGDFALANTQEILHGSSVPHQATHRDMLQYYIVPDDENEFSHNNLFKNIPPDSEMVDLLNLQPK